MFRKIKDRIRKFIAASTYQNFNYDRKKQNDEILLGVQRLLAISNLHRKTFAGFKGCYEGKDVAIVGAGPSVVNFKPINDCIYIGLNSACVLQSIKFDYLFSIDKSGIDKVYGDFASVDCVKFIGDQNFYSPDFQISESVISKMGNVRRYKTNTGLYAKSKFAYDIESEPLGNFNTVALQAIQFALYTNPQRIYLIGIDCTPNGHFHNKQNSAEEISSVIEKRKGVPLDKWAENAISGWKELKDFVQIYYPSTEIVSINPVGLRGIFIDMYQE